MYVDMTFLLFQQRIKEKETPFIPLYWTLIMKNTLWDYLTTVIFITGFNNYSGTVREVK